MAKNSHPKRDARAHELAVDQVFQNPNNEPIKVDLSSEMRQSFIDYAMSVISDRALPDARDGLKPVHRRILYSMYTQGFTHDKPYRKCATTVGDVLGRFHPHGDAAVYDALVRMAQDFSMRHPMIDGHGNFGSMDGDPPAAYRYTEARLSRIAGEMMNDINRDTVDFVPNYDERIEEPVVLPAAFPNLLVSGSTGIAVGMATNIPPHNLREVIEGTIYMIDHPEATSDDLMDFISAPDFPTGGIIMGTSGIRKAYRTGRGQIVVRGRAEIEEGKGERTRILVTDLPYMVNKARLIERIAELVKEKRIDGISDVRDESDRHDPVRIVVELKRDATPLVVLNQLYKNTQLQSTFGAIMLALVTENGKYVPRLLSLRDMVQCFVDHKREVVTRRVRFDLAKAEARLHLVEGLEIAIDHIDEVVSIIRHSSDEEQAKRTLSERFGLSEKQSQHVVDMRLGRLSGLEREKLQNEHQELKEKIAWFNRLLTERDLMSDVMKDELLVIADKYGDERRTDIEENGDFEVDDESLIEDEDVVVTMTHSGYIKRIPISVYSVQKRGGKGISGIQTKEEDFVSQIITTTALQNLMFFTNTGRCYCLKCYRIPEGKRQAKGMPIVNLLNLDENEKVVAFLPIKEFDAGVSLIMVTRNGIVKKTPLKNYANINKRGIIAIQLKDGDDLAFVRMTDEAHDIILVTQDGYSIRFPESDIRGTSRNTMGVRGIDLRAGDAVIGMVSTESDDTLMVVTENGLGKRTELSEYRVQKRGGKGVITYKVAERTGKLVGAEQINDDKDIILINEKGVVIRFSASDIPVLGRSTSGVMLMRSRDGYVVSLAVTEKEEVETDLESEDTDGLPKEAAEDISKETADKDSAAETTES